MPPDQRAASRAEDLREQWALLSRQLADLEKDRITETRTEERFRLEELITRKKEDRWQLERELHELEAQPEFKAGSPGQATTDDLCPSWLREQLLRRFRNDLSCRLESFFGEHSFVALPKNFSPTDVSRAHSLREKIIEYSLEQAGGQVRTIERDVVEIFNQPDINQRLAILGKPGSGKTSCLLRIFAHLLEAAEQDAGKQMPVVFECSEWNGRDLSAWMAHQLVVKYDLQKERARKLVQGDLLFPLFDGLDELKGELQEGFVEAFNAFQHGRPMLLCCRIDEYRHLQEKVQLNNALVLHDISAQRLEEYLKREKQEDLWRFLEAEPSLLELARRPLFLSIMLQLEENKLLSENRGVQKGEDAEQFLWRLYLDCCLDETPPGELGLTASRKRKYTKEQSLHWLRCLADKMTAERIVELRIEEMQPSWLYNTGKFKPIIVWGSGFCLSLLSGIVWGILFQPILALFYGMSIWIAYGLMVITNKWISSILFGLSCVILFCYCWIVYGMTAGYWSLAIIVTKIDLIIGGGTLTGLIIGKAAIVFNLLQTDSIVKIKKISFANAIQNIKKIFISLAKGMIYGLSTGMGFSIIVAMGLGMQAGAVYGLALGMLIGVLVGVVVGIKQLEVLVVEEIAPGQTLSYAIRNSLFLALTLSTICMVVYVKVLFLAEQLGVIEGTLFHIPSFCLYYFNMSMCIFWGTGAVAVFAHYVLRLLLWQEGQLPFRLVSWLEDLHQRKLLQRVGGSYHFIHKRLQEYLAQMNEAETHKVP